MRRQYSNRMGLLALSAAAALVGGCTPWEWGRPDYEILYKMEAKAPLNIAYQGAPFEAPENTIVSFEKAIEAGADALEFQVRMTKDEHLVVIHDATVDRTTDGEGAVHEMTLDEIRALDAGYRFSPPGQSTHPFRGKGVKVPTLNEILESFPATILYIDVRKESSYSAPSLTMGETILRRIEEAGAEEHVVLISNGDLLWMPTSDVAFASGKTNISVAMSAHDLGFNLEPDFCRVYRVPEFDEEEKVRIVRPEFLKVVHDGGMPAHVYLIDQEADMKRLLDMGVDGIITRRPDVLARVIEQRKTP